MSTNAKRSRLRTLLLVVGGLVLACILCTIVVSILPDSDDEAETVAQATIQPGVTDQEEQTDVMPEPTQSPAPLPTTTSSPTPGPTATSSPIPPTQTPILGLIEPGTHIVGEDMDPGIYWGTAGEDILGSCYWARLSDLSGELDAILANDNAVGQFYVEVKEADVAFETDCELIYLEYAPVPENRNPETIDPGVYLVGRDIQPGRYRGEAGEDILGSCYWARLQNVSGDLNSIIANDNATGQYFVQVAETDFALSTACRLEFDQP